jgi:pimeloyl-ACP methyl ester carboxylesterase
MRRLLIATLVSTLAILGAPTAAEAEPAVEASPRAEPSSALRWSACEGERLEGAQCAFLRVPRDWARPTAGTYRIAVARIRAEVAPTRGVLMFNPGGPGGAGLDALRGVQRGLPKAVRDSFDVVTFDPRGVGRSQPTFAPCRTPQPDFPLTGEVDWQAVTSDHFDAMSAALQECLAANETDAEFVGTWQVIRDMDSLRRALGVERISFWGMSYGTTVGRAYAQQFPQRLRALVLDGTITPTPSVGDYAREHIWDDATAIQTMLGAFGAKSKRAYRTVMNFLESQPIATEDGQVLTRWSVSAYLVTYAAYQSQWNETRQTLNKLYAAIRSARSVDREVVQRIASSAVTTSSDGGSNPAYFFVNCSDMHDRPTAQVIAGAAEQAAKVGGTPLGAPPLGEGTQCAGLPPLGRSVPPLAGTLRLPTPPVIVNSIGDNRTPWLGARATANAFTGSSMVTYAGTQHVAYTGTSACVDAAVTPYLLGLTLPPRSVACPLVYP